MVGPIFDTKGVAGNRWPEKEPFIGEDSQGLLHDVGMGIESDKPVEQYATLDKEWSGEMTLTAEELAWEGDFMVRDWFRIFSSRRHFARLLENHTWILPSAIPILWDSLSRANTSG